MQFLEIKQGNALDEVKCNYINPPPDGAIFSEVATSETRCPLCKRYPIRYEFPDAPRGSVKLCQRCYDGVSHTGFDDDFYWGLENTTQEMDINLRWDTLKCIRVDFEVEHSR
jgi:hypothetical protein